MLDSQTLEKKQKMDHKEQKYWCAVFDEKKSNIVFQGDEKTIMASLGEPGCKLYEISLLFGPENCKKFDLVPFVGKLDNYTVIQQEHWQD